MSKSGTQELLDAVLEIFDGQRVDSTCSHCGIPFARAMVLDELGDLFAQADALGMDSLTEEAQLVIDGKCCVACYYER